MQELRLHLDDAADFLARVRRQQAQGYALPFVEHDGEVCAVAGWRSMETLFAGKVVYVDDLVTRSGEQSKGHGATLFRWLVERARATGCSALHLDSGVQRFGAHRFYLREQMQISSHHFVLRLT